MSLPAPANRWHPQPSHDDDDEDDLTTPTPPFDYVDPRAPLRSLDNDLGEWFADLEECEDLYRGNSTLCRILSRLKIP